MSKKLFNSNGKHYTNLSPLTDDQSDDESNANITIYASLKNWDTGAFVPVSDSRGVYYGGYQGWLTDENISKFWANRSCGVTAAANMLYYIAKNISGKSELYTKSDITKASFSSYQRQIYDHSLSPAVYGIPGSSSMKRKVENWASSRNVPLTGRQFKGPWNVTSVRNYIVEGLNAERPVLLQTWYSPIPELAWHWVTVTRIYNDGTDKILTSNWGRKVVYDFETWCKSPGIYKSILYFD